MYFEILSNGANYWWRIKGANHEIMATSEMLNSKQACQNAINVVKLGASNAPVYDRT